MTEFDRHLSEAQTVAADFITSLNREQRIVVFCHFDADGLAAGALFGRGLSRLGYTDVHVEPSQRGESAFSESARQRIAALAPAALIVTDLGIHRSGVLPDLPTLYVDHHQPEGIPQGATIVSGYTWEPVPNSSWLAWELLAPLTAMNDLLWIAAIGTLSDLGNDAPWPHLAHAKKQYSQKWLKEAVVLVNAARRASEFDIQTPLRMLMECDHPRSLSTDIKRGARRLARYRREVNEALQEARKHAPVFSATHPFALIRLYSACQVHPLIAQQWRTRLPKYAVIAANTGYLPGLVAFSTRTSRTDLNLPDIYRSVDLGEYNGDFGHGHDQASGGHLPPEAFNALLDALGFEEVAHVATDVIAGV